MERLLSRFKVVFMGGGAIVMLVLLIAGPVLAYFAMKIEVPSRHIAVLVRKTGENPPNGSELAPSMKHKGVQRDVLGEGRYFRNPYTWAWFIVPQVEIPEGKLGVRTRLHGDNLEHDQVIAWKENQKGIIPEVLRPGRYALNARVRSHKALKHDLYAELIDLYDPLTIPAGFKGVVTDLSAPIPEDTTQLLTEPGRRGVQEATFEPGTYYVNPFLKQINLLDCRSKRYNLTEGGQMGFPSKDGFFITLEGVIEFRVKPEAAALVYVTYNSRENDTPVERIDEEIVRNIILPNARSYCRLRGSNQSGREFISGETRVEFQQNFQTAMSRTCAEQGVEIIQALITKIRPPEKISEPVRVRQIALQQEKQFRREILQQKSEEQLAIEQELVRQKQAVVASRQIVVKQVTAAERMQEVALIDAKRNKSVAEFELKAAEDLAAAILAEATATAEIIHFGNDAEAAGWRKAVEAFDGNGGEYARWVMLRKLAPSYRSIMVNTADSPLMDVFEGYKKEAGQ